MSIRILLVDDHTVVRQGLRMFLSLDTDLEVIGEAADGVEAIEQAHRLQPDVVLKGP
ncbi:MAG: response regulator transcription factor [Anaerolineae bacterium]|nr:response regulator transcription factor [Anaerolineae bacterium]